MRTVRPLIVVVLAVLLASFAPGCGGDSEPTPDEYERAVVEARDRTDFALARITRSKSMDELVIRLGEAGDAITAAADDLDDTGAPEVFVDENAKLVRSLRALGNDVGVTADQVEEPGFENLLLGARGLNFESWDKVNLALAGLIGEGVRVELLATHAPDE
jgi:hypothetical protein